MVFRSTGPRHAPVLLLVLGAALIGVIVIHHALRPRPASIGAPVPALALTTLAGNAVSMQPPAGVTLYNVFATWCEPCRMETPMLASQARLLAAHGISVVGIDQGESPAAVRSFVGEYGLPYRVLIDNDHVTDALLGAHVIPETLLVRNGILDSVYVGPLDVRQLHELVGVH